MSKTCIKFLKKVIAHEKAKPFFSYPVFIARAWICRRRYKRKILECRAKIASGERLRVVFLVSNCSKWKCQGIYEIMAKSRCYDPVMAVTTCDDELYLSDVQLQMRIDSDMAYYKSLGNCCMLACDVKTRRVTPLSEFDADIVFMQVPWGLLPGQDVFSISRYALVCYVPYGIDCTEIIGKSRRFNWHHLAYFHLLLWRYFTISESFAAYLAAPHWRGERAGEIVGTGHPALDFDREKPQDEELKECVVYAPHFGFEWNGIRPIDLFSTFHWSGRFMLEYAKMHPEVKWVFKPHPLLRGRVLLNGFMTEAEVDAYYGEWERIGVACYDAGYQRIFHASRALITDCGSFLFEYSAFDKPLIRLVPENTNITPAEPAKAVFSTFYTCHDLDELSNTLKMIIEDSCDPNADSRHDAVRQAGLMSTDAAEKVVRHISGALVDLK